jgi:hypothetical protein
MRPKLLTVAEVLFRSIDEDDDLRVHKREFYELISVLDVSFEVKTKEPRTALRQRIFNVVTHKYFEYLVDLCILINGLRFIAIDSWNVLQPLEVQDWVFTVFFTGEIGLKMYSFGVREYFRNPFRRFDFLSVVLNVFRFAVQLASPEWIVKISAVIAVCRIVRLIRLVRILHRFPVVMATAARIISLSAKIFFLLGLLFFIYAVIGMQMYAGKFDVSRDPNLKLTPMGQKNLFLFNYDSLPASYVTLFHCFFGYELYSECPWSLIVYFHTLIFFSLLSTISTGQCLPSYMKRPCQ